MEDTDSFELSLVDVQKLTVEDISKEGFQVDLRHLSPWERNACCSFISALQSKRKSIDKHNARLSVDPKELAERLGCLSPRRKPFSHIGTPAPSVERLTPPYFEYVEDRPRREKEAYETLIQEGGQPSHPIGITFSDAKKLPEYKHIISYWTEFGECYNSPYSTQLAHWRSFRTFQENIRARYESQNSFPDYLHHINELRRRYNLEGNADARLDYTEQSGLDDWMEYQHQHLENCENLEEPLSMAKAELDAAKEGVYEAGDSQFGDKYEEIRADGTEAEGYSAPSREPHSWKKLNRKIHKAKTATKYKEREVQLLEHKANVAEADGSKERSESDQTEAAEAMKELEKAKKKVTKLELRLNLVEAARALASIQTELKFHKVLVDWTEQQKPLIAARENAGSQRPKPQLACSGRLSRPGDDWEEEEEELRAAAAKRLVWDHMSSIIIKGKRNQFPILDICKRRSKRIASRKEKRRAREQERIPLRPSKAVRVLLRKNLNLDIDTP